MRERRKMQTFDWLNWAALVAIGVFLGLAIDAMVESVKAGYWRTTLFTLFVFGCWFLFYLFLERLFDFIFSGRFFATKQKLRKPMPFALVFSLPLGITIGAIGAQFGLNELLL